MDNGHWKVLYDKHYLTQIGVSYRHLCKYYDNKLYKMRGRISVATYQLCQANKQNEVRCAIRHTLFISSWKS